MPHDVKVVEGVARALCVQSGCTDPSQRIGWDHTPGADEPRPAWHDFRQPAIAALDAIEAMGMVVVPSIPTLRMHHEASKACHIDRKAFDDLWYRVMVYLKAARPGAQPQESKPCSAS